MAWRRGQKIVYVRQLLLKRVAFFYFALVAFAVSPFCSAHAESLSPGQSSWVGSWLSQDTLTGNWRGERDAIKAKGLTFSANYTTDILGNASGGVKRAL